MENGETNHRYLNWLMILLFLTWGFVFLDRMTVLYLGPFLVKSLHMNPGQIGLLASALAVTWAISSFLFGNVSDRVGRRPVLLPAVFLFSILSWVSGLVRSFGQLFVVRGVMGVTEGPTWSTIMATIGAESPKKSRGRNTGFVQSASGLVGLAAAPILATQIAAHFGWQTAFFVAGIPGIILGLILIRFMREPRRAALTASLQPAVKQKKAPISVVLKQRNVWLSCLSAIGFMIWLFVLSSFAPLYLTQVAHERVTTAGFVLGAGGVGSFLWGFGVPWISDRIGRKAALLLFGFASAVVPIACLYLGHSPYLAALLFLLTWCGNGCADLNLVLIPSESVSPALAATAIGLPTMAGELFGGTAAPAIAGAVANHAGLGAAMWIAAGGAALMAIAAIPMVETSPRFQTDQSNVPDTDVEMA
ncbi:MFS transporter [Alicyclobacillus cycloheptanicus]|uniref:MFS family permease n=1 Tax=Alicyclobacillus cycloheptanicus TaxID=1457 RepID=A0ABT9XMH0_9BACL|nr:MFS transporter [Alicyclobacillus cycloheptanicus]MDQ0191516.1 MFS family permease [Alicyclobacillus cycloheptanicus]WDM00152.1 MFS transporter [Alicyclobacillus cycloheptanicus]